MGPSLEVPPLLLKLVFDQIEKARMPWIARPIAKAISAKTKSAFILPSIRQHLDYMEAELGKSEWFAGSEFSKVDQLVLAGGCASIPGIAEMIEEQLGVPAVVANPLAGMSLSGRVQAQTLAQDAPALMIACGLALRSFD